MLGRSKLWMKTRADCKPSCCTISSRVRLSAVAVRAMRGTRGMSGIDANAVADIGAIAPMVSTLIQGMSVALYTTLVGSVFHVWLLVNYQVLATGTVNLANTIIERAEAPARFGNAGEQVSYA